MKTTSLSLYVMHLLYVHVIKKKLNSFNHCITLYKLNFKKGKKKSNGKQLLSISDMHLCVMNIQVFLVIIN